MRGFAQPTTYVVTIMKNFLTALASALLVAVIVTSLHYFVFSNDLDRAPLALFILSFLGMAGVALFNVRLSALRSGIGAGVAAGAGAVTGSAVAKAGQTGAIQSKPEAAQRTQDLPIAVVKISAMLGAMPGATAAGAVAKTRDPMTLAQRRQRQPQQALLFQMVPEKMAP